MAGVATGFLAAGFSSSLEDESSDELDSFLAAALTGVLTGWAAGFLAAGFSSSDDELSDDDEAAFLATTGFGVVLKITSIFF